MDQDLRACCHIKKNCISLVPIFNHLKQHEMDEIMEKVTPRKLQKGEFLYQAGDESDSLSIVHQGKLKIYRLSGTGKEQILRILSSGDFTGELALFKKSFHDSYAEALEDTRVCQIKRSDLQEILLKYPSISLEILKELSERLEQSEMQATRIATDKVERRIALYLTELVERQNQMEIFLPLSRKDLSSYLGTTPETLSRKLAEMEEEGILSQKGARKIKILNLGKLQSL